jgi:hypothetical protein
MMDWEFVEGRDDVPDVGNGAVEIIQLREKLRIAEDCLIEYEVREIDSGNLRGGIAAEALKKIRGM